MNKNHQRAALPRPSSGLPGIAMAGIFLAAAILIHLIPGILFRAKPPSNIEKPSGKHRNNLLIRESDPAFRAMKERFTLLTDPAAFIHGGEPAGYSSFRSTAGDPGAADLPFHPLQLVKQPSAEPVPGTAIEPLFPARTYSDWLPFPLLKSVEMISAPSDATQDQPSVHYPLWLDEFGKKLDWNNSGEEERMTRFFCSKDVIGPTCLRVEDPREKGLPPDTVLIHSCGSIVLDLYAKRKCDSFLQSLSPVQTAVWKKGKLVRILWREDVPLQPPGSTLKGLFPEAVSSPGKARKEVFP